MLYTKGFLSLFIRFKVLFAYQAKWAGPVIGEVFKGSSRGNVVFGITYIGVVHPVAYSASILLHGGVGL
jgi:uncharacterized membrane protein (DUF485 family)